MLEKSSASIRNFPIPEFTPSVALRRQLEMTEVEFEQYELDLIREAAANDGQCLQEFLWAATKDLCTLRRFRPVYPHEIRFTCCNFWDHRRGCDFARRSRRRKSSGC